MKKNGLLGTLLAAILVIILGVVLAASVLITSRYCFVGLHLYPRDQELLDLQSSQITPDVYEKLAWMLPDTTILWSVPLSSGTYSSAAETLTVTSLTDSDVDMLPYFYSLKILDGTGCSDYQQLAMARAVCENVDVRYNVPVSGQSLPADTTAVTVTSLTQADAENLSWLPLLRTIDATACKDYAVLSQLREAHPSWEIRTIRSIAGTPIDAGAESVTYRGAAYEELSIGLGAMPALQEVLISEPKASVEELLRLREEYPNISIHWQVEIHGKTWRDDIEELDISGTAIPSIAQARQWASWFPDLKTLVVENGTIPDQEMADFREEMRSSYKVVWIIEFTKIYKLRSDSTIFYPTGAGEYYFKEEHVGPMKYLEDMVCVDIGDMPGVRTIDFAAYMPHLKYLILAWTNVTDISPLANCKELVYLELDHTIVHDFTPLQGCTALEDLNINDHMYTTSIEPLLSCTWLKVLWITDDTWGWTAKNQLKEALPNTRVETVNYSSSTGMGWRNLQNYYDMRKTLGAEPMA